MGVRRVDRLASEVAVQKSARQADQDHDGLAKMGVRWVDGLASEVAVQNSARQAGQSQISGKTGWPAMWLCKSR